VFSAAQAEPGLLEGEDWGEPEKGSVGEPAITRARVEGFTDTGMSVERFGAGGWSGCRGYRLQT